MYQGPVNVGSNPRSGQPENCKRGTFCRNPTPKDQPWPWCLSELTGEVLMCRVVGCGQGKPKYAGNRGVQAKMTLNYPGGQVSQTSDPKVVRKLNCILGIVLVRISWRLLG